MWKYPKASQVRASPSRTLEGLNPGQVLHGSPVQVDDGADHHDMHDLVAVPPVVEQAGAETLGDLDHIDQPAQHSQGVHDDEEPQRVGASHAVAINPEQEEADAEQGLPDKRPQAQEVCVGRGGAVDPVGWQEDVGQHGGLLDGRVAQEGDVNDGKSSWTKTDMTYIRFFFYTTNKTNIFTYQPNFISWKIYG